MSLILFYPILLDVSNIIHCFNDKTEYSELILSYFYTYTFYNPLNIILYYYITREFISFMVMTMIIINISDLVYSFVNFVMNRCKVKID